VTEATGARPPVASILIPTWNAADKVTWSPGFGTPPMR